MEFLRDLAILALGLVAILSLISLLLPYKRRGVGLISRKVVVKYVSATIPGTPAARVLQAGDEILDLQVSDDSAEITFKRGHGTAIVKVPRVDLPVNAFTLARKKA